MSDEYVAQAENEEEEEKKGRGSALCVCTDAVQYGPLVLECEVTNVSGMKLNKRA